MTMNGNLSRWVLDGMFITLIAVSGFLGVKVDTKVETHEMRLQAIELNAARLDVKLDYVIKNLEEIKSDVKAIRGKSP